MSGGNLDPDWTPDIVVLAILAIPFALAAPLALEAVIAWLTG